MLQKYHTFAQVCNQPKKCDFRHFWSGRIYWNGVLKMSLTFWDKIILFFGSNWTKLHNKINFTGVYSIFTSFKARRGLPHAFHSMWNYCIIIGKLDEKKKFAGLRYWTRPSGLMIEFYGSWMLQILWVRKFFIKRYLSLKNYHTISCLLKCKMFKFTLLFKTYVK